MNKENLYVSDDGDSYAVLVSPGWGAGWSTWNNPQLAYDKRVVELFLSGYRITDAQNGHDAGDELMQRWGYSKPYWGGWNHIRVEWIPFGVRWRITEYDGNESIEYLDVDKYTCFEKRGN